jgi:chorismate mutase
MYVRGIRGATTVERNEEQLILQATAEMLEAIIAQNGLSPEDIASVFVTVTPDLTATFPAKAIRGMAGWELVPLMCSVEIPVKGALPLCVRLMVLSNTTKSQEEIVHVYLGDAQKLRPDLVKG